MKKLALIFTLALTSLVSLAQEKTEGITITVVTENFLNNEGKAMYALHTEDTFMKGPGVQNAESKIEDGKVTITFKNVTPGTYAIMLLHDVNENQKMDFDASGMPKESYGMSGNDMSFGPPQFDSAKFEVNKEDLNLNIRL
ncbi:DUF2141 domain-containing protein [Spongiivirga sp. MCCC 1A20706]|uniref:DUF2141 domain-containing protein n=1 Tax=Spongiivirga sp. MCCC 1A20706 TaxID=3160963 RepID=UPI0039773DFF